MYTVDNILLQRFEYVFNMKGITLAWFISYLSDRLQFVGVIGESSSYTGVVHGVPQGCVLGSRHFTLCIFPLGAIIRLHGLNFHSFI